MSVLVLAFGVSLVLTVLLPRTSSTVSTSETPKASTRTDIARRFYRRRTASRGNLECALRISGRGSKAARRRTPDLLADPAFATPASDRVARPPQACGMTPIDRHSSWLQRAWPLAVRALLSLVAALGLASAATAQAPSAADATWGGGSSGPVYLRQPQQEQEQPAEPKAREVPP